MNAIFDFNTFLQRKRLKHREVAEQIGASMGLIGSWASNKALPSYEKMAKLIECGMTAKELFGKDLAEELLRNSGNSAEGPAKKDFIAGVKEALAELSRIK